MAFQICVAVDEDASGFGVVGPSVFESLPKTQAHNRPGGAADNAIKIFRHVVATSIRLLVRWSWLVIASLKELDRPATSIAEKISTQPKV